MYISFTWLTTADDDSDKRQTRPLVREGVPRKQDRNCQTVINIWSWAPYGARHQDWLTDRQTQCDFELRDPLFLGDINTETWPSRMEEPRIWDSKIRSWVSRNLDPRMTALATASSNCKRQTHPLVREDAPHRQTRKCLMVIKLWSWTPNGCSTSRKTGRLTVARNIILNLTSA
jgi:hypothetical protein